MAFTDLRGVMRANLPEPPARVLEVGAGAGRLARALRAVGCDVLEPESDDVRAVAFADLDEPAGSFAAAIAVVSLHHSTPLDDSCRRLGELVEPGGTLLLDEFAVGALTPLPLRGWLEQRRARSANRSRRPPRSSSRSAASTCTRSSGSSQHSSRISSSASARRYAAPGCTAGTSASRCARSKRRRSPAATCAPSRGHPLRSGSKVSLARRTDDSKGGEI
jgi:Methyltransferase domain